MDSIPDARNFEVGISATTMDDSIPKLFEPDAPSIPERIPFFSARAYVSDGGFYVGGDKGGGAPVRRGERAGCRWWQRIPGKNIQTRGSPSGYIFESGRRDGDHAEKSLICDYGFTFTDIRITVGLGEDYFAIFDYGHSSTGNVMCLPFSVNRPVHKCFQFLGICWATGRDVTCI
jgi:hypothetical protein